MANRYPGEEFGRPILMHKDSDGDTLANSNVTDNVQYRFPDSDAIYDTDKTVGTLQTGHIVATQSGWGVQVNANPNAPDYGQIEVLNALPARYMIDVVPDSDLVPLNAQVLPFLGGTQVADSDGALRG